MGCLVALGIFILLAAIGSQVEKPTEEAAAPELDSMTDANPRDDSEKTEALEPETEGQSLTAAQRNAVRSAEQYLSMTGFSRAGLINQLSSDAGDGYLVSDATAAVDSLSVDWNENAAKSARQYLSMSGFSCDGLIEQLSSSAGDKYTVEQARYGARQAGVC